MKLKKIIVKNYRSINNLSIDFDKNPLIICWSNNVWKTNFLRALKLFFSLDINWFNPKEDFPYDIEEWTRWGWRKIRFDAHIEDWTDKYLITVEFKNSKEKWNHITIKWTKNRQIIEEKKCTELIQKFNYIFIEASNVDVPHLISKTVNDEILPILDKQRSKQSKALESLNDFIKKSKTAVKTIESLIWQQLLEFLDIDGINTSDRKIEIQFPEFNKLREAISGLIDFTLYDRSWRKLATKWSGIQRIILYSLIKYIVETWWSNIILAIDEPDVFLQPALQKHVYKIFHKLSESAHLVFSTHSPNLINIEDLSNVVLFKAEYEKRPIKRKKWEEFYKVKTIKDESTGIDKIQLIKNHLWIRRNDWWEIFKYNFLVEWEDDKNILGILFKKLGYESPNILVSWWVDKIKWYLQFLQDLSTDLSFKPKIFCIVDNDTAWKTIFQEKDRIKVKHKNIDVDFIKITRFDWIKDDTYDHELEDFIYPEIFLNSINKILKKKWYKTLAKTSITNRTKTAFDKQCVLTYFTNLIQQANPSKEALNMSDLSIKKRLNQIIYLQIKDMDPSQFEVLNLKYPEVKNFIDSLNTKQS